MDKTTLHITEYRGNQLIDFFGITSFKVQNHGEAVVEINNIPIYPDEMVKIVEEDGTMCNFMLQANFTEEGKIPKFKVIYKQFGNADCYPHLHPALAYTATLYNYEQGDIVDFSQNISGHTILTRSFDGGVTFPQENDIDLGFIEANQVITYDLGGSLDTNAIQLRNNDLAADSEIFIVAEVPYPFEVYDVNASNRHPHFSPSDPNAPLGFQDFVFTPNKAGNIQLEIEIGSWFTPTWEEMRTYLFPNCVKDVPVITNQFFDFTGFYTPMGFYAKWTNLTTNEMVVWDNRR